MVREQARVGRRARAHVEDDDAGALRERAIDELAAALAALHATPTDGLDAPDLWPPHTLPLEPLRRLIAELAAAHPEH